jgi:hypothetical protein
MDAVAAGADMPRSSSEMGVWLVAHLVRDEGVAGSNPATPTTFSQHRCLTGPDMGNETLSA